MSTLQQALDAALAEADGAGIVGAERAGETLLRGAWGLADRRLAVPMTPEHRLAVASGSKGFTALVVMSLVNDGVLSLDTTARSLLGDDLPLIDDAVTIRHLLAHRSGIGEYLDDDADAGEYLLKVPVHTLVSPEDYLPILDGLPQLFAPNSDFQYCNGGFIVLSLLAQRAAGRGFHDLVRERVFSPAGMAQSDYLRSDDLPSDAALGYVEVDGQWRSNVLHLPVIGGGDGGAFTTLDDLGRFWRALQAGAILPQPRVEELTSPVSDDGDGWFYGLGFWLNPEQSLVTLIGEDAGVSFRSTHRRSDDLVFTVIGTTADAAWPVVGVVKDLLGIH